MKQIVFKHMTEDGEVHRMGSARMKDGRVTIEFKEPRVQKNLELDRININGQVLTQRDGVDFLLGLPQAYSGSRIWAEIEDIRSLSMVSLWSSRP